MQSVGDQVSTLVSSLERDHITALQHIDELIAANASITAERDALKSANTVLEKQLTDSTVALLDTEEHLADAIKMVDAVGAAALDMLKVVKRPFGSPSPQKADAGTNGLRPYRPIAAPPIVPVLITDEMLKPDFAQRVAGDVMADDPPLQGDSGDEAEEKPIAAPAAQPAPAPAPVDLAPIKEAIEKKLDAVWDSQLAAADDAMSRMGRGPSAMKLPPVTMRGAEPARPQLTVVNGGSGGLPIFLRRDMVFQRGDGPLM